MSVGSDVVGWIATVFTLFFFLSPIPTCKRILLKKDAEFFSPVPYFTAVFNCSLWTFYCLITPGGGLAANLTINLTGAVLETFYIVVFLLYSRHRSTVLLQLAFVACGIGLVILLTFTVVPEGTDAWGKFKWGSDYTRSSAVGAFTDILNIAMYGSPLVVMARVVATKSVEYMPLPVSLMVFVCSTLWAAQGLMLQNQTIYIPNVLGVLLGVAQLVLYAMYRNSTPVPSSKDPETEERDTGKLPLV
mmetsp:Transcript_18783/g.46104  ORF Transcript_18783/g.46104 Transcript_18783/m.46104 type:complete len:246 (+) Transcript_18783:45-782(+)